MIQHTLINDDGEQCGVLIANTAGGLAANTPAGMSTVAGTAPNPTDAWRGGLWVPRPPAPSEEHSWSGSARAWIDDRPLENLKAAARMAVQAQRITEEARPLRWDGSTFDADAGSLNRLAAASAGLQGTVLFTLANNTDRALSSADIDSVLAAYGSRMRSIHATARSIKAAITDAPTRQAVRQALRSATWPAP